MGSGGTVLGLKITPSTKINPGTIYPNTNTYALFATRSSSTSVTPYVASGKTVTVAVYAYRSDGGGFDPYVDLRATPFNQPNTTYYVGNGDDDSLDNLNSKYTSVLSFDGTYFATVSAPRNDLSSVQPYYVEWNQDDAGNSLSVAQDIGSLSSSIALSDFVGMSDTNDYYRFTLSSTKRVNLSLVLPGGLNGDADLELLRSDGSIIQSSAKSGTASEQISQVLNSGTYYVRVYPYKTEPQYNSSINDFTAPFVGATYTLGISATSIAASGADFNNDGKSDLVWRNYATGENAIWLMNGTTLSQGVFTTPVADRNWSIAGTGDFNNDGKSDLIWRNGSAGKNAVWLMNGTNLSQGILLNTDVTDPNWRLGNAYPGNPNVFPGRR